MLGASIQAFSLFLHNSKNLPLLTYYSTFSRDFSCYLGLLPVSEIHKYDLSNLIFHLLPLPYILDIPIYQLPLVTWTYYPYLYLQTCTSNALHHTCSLAVKFLDCPPTKPTFPSLLDDCQHTTLLQYLPFFFKSSLDPKCPSCHYTILCLPFRAIFKSCLYMLPLSPSRPFNQLLPNFRPTRH